ncbi:MAG: hypothetical protein Q9172_001824 [Xanthocarpia lactea]
MPASLDDLPPELLGHIVSYIEEAVTLLRLTLTCKKLHGYVERDGYRIFVQRRFPHPVPPFWKEATHALTKLSRAWDHKSLITRYIEPPQNAIKPRTRKPGVRVRGQTMDYQPVIDSYETWTGSDWTSRREAVAWGAGAHFVLRVKWIGPDIDSKWQRTKRGKSTFFDQHHHSIRWWRISEPTSVDGTDDITTISLLRNEQKPSSDAEYLVVGRASGGLELVSVQHKVQWSWKSETRFDTDDQSVSSASVNTAVHPLLAACLGDRTIAIYQILTIGQDLIQPLGRIRFESLGSPCRLRSTVFLRQDRLAVSLGPHVEPIRIFDVRPDAIPSKDIRRFSFAESDSGRPATAYPLSPLPRSSCPCESEGDLFLSGGYDGIIRLHDLRSSASSVATFHDPVDSTAAIYSLLPLGRDRFLAGSALFATIKLFNMQTVVEKLCHHDTPRGSLVKWPRAQPSTSSHDTDPCHMTQGSDQKPRSRDWTCFLANREDSNERRSWRRREWTSPVYSLSSPSLYSPTFFAGIEGHVIQVDVASAYDRFPDPIYRYGPEITGDRDRDATRKWDPNQDVMCVDLYEHVNTSIKLMHQTRIGERKPGAQMPGWDERWLPRGGIQLPR